MKILFYISSLSAGGGERVTATLANYWANKGWQVTIATLASKKEDFYQLHPAVNRIALNLLKESSDGLTAVKNNLHRVTALRCVLKTVKPDIAISMMNTSNVHLALASIGLQNLITVGSERIYPPQISLNKPWEIMRYILYKKLSALVALTKESAVWLRQHTKARRVVVIPNFVTYPLPRANVN